MCNFKFPTVLCVYYIFNNQIKAVKKNQKNQKQKFRLCRFRLVLQRKTPHSNCWSLDRKPWFDRVYLIVDELNTINIFFRSYVSLLATVPVCHTLCPVCMVKLEGTTRLSSTTQHFICKIMSVPVFCFQIFQLSVRLEVNLNTTPLWNMKISVFWSAN